MNPKPNILLITGQWSKKTTYSTAVPLKLVNILKHVSGEITWIVTNWSIPDELRKEYLQVNFKKIECSEIEGKTFLKMLITFFLYQTLFYIPDLH